MLIMEDLQDMDESILIDLAGIGELLTFKTVSPQLKHSVLRLSISLIRNDFSFVVDQLVDILSLLRYRLQATLKCLREQHHFMAFQIWQSCMNSRTSLNLNMQTSSLVGLLKKSLMFIKRGHLFITLIKLSLLYW